MKADCGGKWREVLACLQQAEGLSIEDDRIVALSMIGEQGVNHIAAAIAILVDADRLVAACTLIRVCEPSVRHELLNLCGSQRVARWRSSDDPQVRNALDRALDAAAHKALRHHKLRELFSLLPICSQATRTGVAAIFPALTVELIGELDGDEFVEAVRLTVERALTHDTAKCLGDLNLLLLFTAELKTRNLPWAVTMMSIICPAMDELLPGADECGLADLAAKLRDMAWLPELTRDLVSGFPASVRSQVLCVAAEQAAVEPDPAVCVNRLLGLAALSDKIGERDGVALRSHIMLVVGWLAVRWSEPAYQAHKSCLESILSKGGSVAPARFSISIKTKTSYAIGKFAKVLIDSTDVFRNAVESGDLFTAALAIRDCPYPEFCNTALRKLAESASETLAAARDDGYLVSLQMAVVLNATGNAECAQLAAEILSTGVQTLEHQQLAILRMMGIEPEHGAVDSILESVANALPRLCGDKHFLQLDVILKMDEGQRLVAQAVVDGFLNGTWTKAAQAGLLFNTLAHRVDLGLALPAIQTEVLLKDGGKALIEQVLGGPIRHTRSWARGWRFIWAMHAGNAAFLNADPRLLMGAKAIDAAAADGLRGGADELLHQLKFPLPQQALDVMLQIKVSGTRLLSDGDLHNVLRAMLSDNQLGRDTFMWMGQVDDSARMVKLHAAAARALISLANDSSRCRFYPDRPANHVVGNMVHLFERRLDFLNIGKKVQSEMGDAWHDISSKFSSRRTGIDPGVG